MNDSFNRILVVQKRSVEASLVENIDWDMRDFIFVSSKIAELSSRAIKRQDIMASIDQVLTNPGTNMTEASRDKY